MSISLLNGLINRPRNVSSLTNIVRFLVQESANQKQNVNVIKRCTKKIFQSISRIEFVLENNDVANSSEVLKEIREDLDGRLQMMNQIVDYLRSSNWEGSEASETINDNPESDACVSEIIEISD